MQKIARRVATAERVVAKRRKARNDTSHKQEARAEFKQNIEHRSIGKAEIEYAKKAIRDDWAMGALSPRRDVGDFHDALGAISHVRYASRDLTLAKRNARCQWAGGAHYLNLAVGDRVVLLDGPEKGRIGKIADINHGTAQVTVNELNKVCVPILPSCWGRVE